jgi:hypothetical protein
VGITCGVNGSACFLRHVISEGIWMLIERGAIDMLAEARLACRKLAHAPGKAETGTGFSCAPTRPMAC